MRPKSLILDLLSQTDPAKLPTSVFLEVARIFRLKENTVRVTLNRLVAAGYLECDRIANESRYALSPRSRMLNRHIVAAQSRRPRTWSGQWLSIFAWAASRERSERDRFRKLLRVSKLANLQPGVWLRPDNLEPSLDELIAEHGFERRVLWIRGPLGCVGPDAVFASRLFSTRRVAKRLASSIRELETSQRHLRNLPLERALVETFLVGGRAIRAMFDDPLLPTELLPDDWPGPALRERFALYNRQARSLWSRALEVELAARAAPAIGSRHHAPLPLLLGALETP